MASPNLLNINVDKLFEQHNISEIDQIHKKLQDEIERKREELRTQVGERYRDLLKAADTIGDMKVTANSLIENVDNIIQSCRNLNDQHLIGFKSEKEYQKVVKKNISNNFHGIIVQIKILTTLPEIIWTNIDNEDYFTATQLFILSRHISTGLQLDTNNDIIKKFPVAKKQWAILSQFFFTIKQSCLTTLEREEITADKATNCLASLLLLENCQLEKLLTIFIQIRSKAFVNVLAEEHPKYDKAKDKILASLNLLNSTVELIYDCFISPGLLIKELTKISSDDSPSTLSLMQSDRSIIIQTLPDIISKFKPRIQVSNELSSTSITTNMQNWIQYIDGVAKNQLKNLINLITSIKVIHQIKKTASTVGNKPKDWNQICQKLALPENLDFYKHFYQNFINLKIKDIIKSSWCSTNIDTTAEFTRLFGGAERNLKGLKTFIWTEEDEDMPQNLKAALDREKLADHKLLMKCRGYSFDVVEICNFIDKRLELLYQDVVLYLDDEPESNLMKIDNEFELIVNDLRECSKESISELISALKSNFSSAENFVVLARLLSAIRELCPHLKHCLSANVKNWSQKSLESSCEQWNSVCCLLNDESLRFWRLWIDDFTETWPKIDTNVEIHTVLQDFPLWDTITIEEKDEQDQTIESVIRVPSQPSFTLHRFFHQICKNLNKCVPQTIPKTVTQLITEKIVEKLHEYYQQLAGNDFVQKHQNAALQYYFDVRFIQLMFVGREQKTMSDQYNQLVNVFKGFIDPFDFDVFYTHLNGNVKKACVRMLHSLGNVIPNMEQLSVVLGQNQYKQEKDPNILALSTNTSAVMFFPLLPVVSTAKMSTGILNVSKTNEPSSNPSRPKTKDSRQPPAASAQSTPATSKTTQNYANAMAFFGLDKDWFK